MSPSTLDMHGRNHMVNGSDPIPGLPTTTGATIAEYLLGLADIEGLWKLNETSGTTAADSANGWDMEPPATVGNPYSAPTWADEVSPFGEDAALFGLALGEANASVPALSGDLTLGIWARRTADAGAGQVIGQGDPVQSNTAGTSLGLLGSGAGYLGVVYVGDTTGGPHVVSSDAALTTLGWYFVVATRTSHIWRLYVNAAAQTGSYDDSGTNYNSQTGAWLGNVPGASTTRYFNGDLSYGFMFSRALTADEIETAYFYGTSPGEIPTGYVWTAPGVWAPPTIEVEF